jgi:hypothetical protein
MLTGIDWIEAPRLTRPGSLPTALFVRDGARPDLEQFQGSSIGLESGCLIPGPGDERLNVAGPSSSPHCRCYRDDSPWPWRTGAFKIEAIETHGFNRRPPHHISTRDQLIEIN